MGNHKLRCYGMNRICNREASVDNLIKEVKYHPKMTQRLTLPSRTLIRFTQLTEEKKT